MVRFVKRVINMDRKGFVRSACMAGVCFCGFGAVPKGASEGIRPEDEEGNPVGQAWLVSLLSNMKQNMDPQQIRLIIKDSAKVHYDQLKMDELLSGYTGKLKEFTGFLEKEWGWKIDYDMETGVLLADENKDHCVCPILKNVINRDTSAICYCSEGFAELMFSKVSGTAVTARVASSVRRGDKSCVYRVEIQGLKKILSE